jgi:hypothetical protein
MKHIHPSIIEQDQLPGLERIRDAKNIELSSRHNSLVSLWFLGILGLGELLKDVV